jgi:hypothetical protein
VTGFQNVLFVAIYFNIMTEIAQLQINGNNKCYSIPSVFPATLLDAQLDIASTWEGVGRFREFCKHYLQL